MPEPQYSRECPRHQEGREEGQTAADEEEFKIPLWIQVQKPSGHVKDSTAGRVMTI